MSETIKKVNKPWEQHEKESSQAFAAFVIYRDMGAGRSVDAAYRAAKGLQESNKRAPGRWREWSLVFDWPTRVSLFDEHLAEIDERAREKAANLKADELAQKRAEFKETEIEVGAALIEKAKLMLEWPVERTVMKNVRNPKTGEMVETLFIEPVRWRFSDVVKMFELASKLSRLGLDLKAGGVGGLGDAGGDGEDGNVQWSVKLPPDVDEETWLSLYKPQIVKKKLSELDPEKVEPVNEQVN